MPALLRPLAKYPLSGLSTAVASPRFRPNATVRFAGDSVTKGLDDSGPVDDVTFRWCKQLEDSLTTFYTALGVPSYSNTAVSGQTTATIAANVATQISDAKKTNLVIMSSVNDMFNGGTPLVGGPLAAQVTAVQGSYRTILRAYFQKTPDGNAHVISPIFLQGENWPTGANIFDASLAALRTGLQAVCAETEFASRTQYIDIAAPSFVYEAANNPGHATNGILTQSLGTHPSKPLGQTQWSGFVFSALTLATS